MTQVVVACSGVAKGEGDIGHVPRQEKFDNCVQSAVHWPF